MTLEEAILFRILGSVFGKDNVIPGMRLKALVPTELEFSCLFTVVNEDNAPKLVVEFFLSDSSTIEVKEIERRALVESVLVQNGIKYITISETDFSDISGADSETLINFFQDKCFE